MTHPNEAALEKLLTLIETAHEHGDECAIIDQAAIVRAALRSEAEVQPVGLEWRDHALLFNGVIIGTTGEVYAQDGPKAPITMTKWIVGSTLSYAYNMRDAAYGTLEEARAALETAARKWLAHLPSPQGVVITEGATSLKELGVDHWHDEEWEFTHPVGDYEHIYDYWSVGEVGLLSTLKKGPDVYAVLVPTGDEDDPAELRFYSTHKAAEEAAALSQGEGE